MVFFLIMFLYINFYSTTKRLWLLFISLSWYALYCLICGLFLLLRENIQSLQSKIISIYEEKNIIDIIMGLSSHPIVIFNLRDVNESERKENQ